MPASFLTIFEHPAENLEVNLRQSWPCLYLHHAAGLLSGHHQR